jgi:hypothetical protein
LDQLSAERVTESGTDADCRCETALREIETPRTARSICNDKDRDNGKDCIRHAIE